MDGLVQIELGDREFVRSVNASMAEAARLSGAWLRCAPGCTQCCIGPFAITCLDALRLRRGLEELRGVDPARSERVQRRAREYAQRIAPRYPGDAVTGDLHDEDALPECADEWPCPALDPDTGLCEVYEARPITCRTFGPATRVVDDALAACELCYEGATEEQIAACTVEVDPEGLEVVLLAELGERGLRGMTIVAFALADGGGRRY